MKAWGGDIVGAVQTEKEDTFELVEAIAEEETDPTAVVKIVNLLLGDAAKSLKEHVRDADGIVDVEAIGVEIKEIFESQKDLKN
ncbi:TPA: hypothetical protein VHF30_000634 [Streptococcus pyogenes]|nr:hypothetical protein [Streptococcus pyogenes]HEQ6719240.1 hypothetical protein [Streptococcus pyogenes]